MGRSIGIILAGMVLAGCGSFRVTQSTVFYNDNGEAVTVEYGRGDKDHVTTYVNPVTGKEIELKSKLRVRVRMPDGEKFMAYQCMNMLRSGTMYKTNDDEWYFHANGFTSSVYRKVIRKDTGKPDHQEVFQGVVGAAPRKVGEK